MQLHPLMFERANNLPRGTSNMVESLDVATIAIPLPLTTIVAGRELRFRTPGHLNGRDPW